MELKPGYKQTEVGVIPEDWECVESGTLVTYFGGNAFKSEAAVRHGVRWLKIANVGKRRAQWTEVSYLPQTYATDFKNYMLREGDVVMALTRPILESELKIAKLTRLDVPALLNQRVAKVLTSSRADLDFIYYVLQTRHFVDSMNEAMAGTDPPNIGSRALGRIPIVLPPTKAEQEAIAEALSDADALIESLEQLIAKKRHLKQGAMQELLTGKKRLPGFSGEWEVKRLGDVATLKNGYAFKSETYSDIGILNIITIANVQDGYMSLCSCNRIEEEPFDLQPHQRLQIGDILISMTGNVGRVCRVSASNCLLNQRVGKLLPYGIVDDLLFFVLSQRSFLNAMGEKATGGAQDNLGKSDITEYAFVIPAEKAEQTAIATILSEMDAEITALEARLAKVRQIKQGMMQELLTGRIRLV
jgi:type I restriction enzyme S subunit